MPLQTTSATASGFPKPKQQKFTNAALKTDDGEAELAPGTPVSHDARELLGGHGRRLCTDQLEPGSPPENSNSSKHCSAGTGAAEPGEATQLARRPVRAGAEDGV